MRNVHYLYWTAGAVVLVVIAVEAYGQNDLPTYVVGMVNAFVGGVSGTAGTIAQFYSPSSAAASEQSE